MLLVLLLRPQGLTGGREVGAESLKGAAKRAGAMLTFRRGREEPPEFESASKPNGYDRRKVSGEAKVQSGPRPAESPQGHAQIQDEGETFLAVTDLTVHYGNAAAVQDLSVTIKQGEIVAMIGPNGAGKSTTLKTVSGFLPATTGSVLFEGESILGETPERVVRRGIALVPEGRQVLGTLSVGENLRLGCTPRRDGRGEIERSLEQVIAHFPILGTYYRSSAGTLSGGEQQQLAIARALLSKPRLLLLDEPSLGLAPMMTEVVFDVLAELRNEGVTVLLIEQNAYAALEIADRAYVLRAGRLVMQGTREELLGHPDFAATYLGSD
jgi:branched-chain amino acid transport system ATP-binding protein